MFSMFSYPEALYRSSFLQDFDWLYFRWMNNKLKRVAIPTHFYKIIVRCKVGSKTSFPLCQDNPEALAFVLPHNQTPACQVICFIYSSYVILSCRYLIKSYGVFSKHDTKKRVLIRDGGFFNWQEWATKILYKAYKGTTGLTIYLDLCSSKP